MIPRTLTATAMAALLVPAWVAAQELKLDFPNLAAQAKEKAEVDLDSSAISAALAMAAGKNEKAGALAKSNALSGITAVHVRHYEFAAEGAYKDSDLDPVRQQAGGSSAWSRIVNVTEPKESTQIYMLKGDSGPGGLLVINSEAKEVNVVEILGTIDLAHLQEVVKSSISYDLKAAAAGQAKQ